MVDPSTDASLPTAMVVQALAIIAEERVATATIRQINFLNRFINPPKSLKSSFILSFFFASDVHYAVSNARIPPFLSAHRKRRSGP